MLTSVLVFAIVPTLAKNVIHKPMRHFVPSTTKTTTEPHTTTTTTEPDMCVNVTSTPRTSTEELFDFPEEPSVDALIAPVLFGASPHWANETQAFYYVSIFSKTLMKYVEGSHYQSKLDGIPTFIIPIEGKKNHFAVGLDQAVVEIQWDGGNKETKVIRTIAEVDLEHPEDRFSHGKADPRGRLFAGTMSHKYDPARTDRKKGSLYQFQEDGSPKKVLENIDVSNGFCWDLADKAFYFIDNSNYSIRRYDYDVESGHISNPQIVFTMQDHEYILANVDPNSFAQDTQDTLYESFDSPGGPLHYFVGSHQVGRQGDAQDYDEGDAQRFAQAGRQGDAQSFTKSDEIEAQNDEGGLLDRDLSDYEEVAQQGPEDDYSVGPKGGILGGPLIRRQGDPQDYYSDPQGFAEDGSQGALQGYAQGDPQGYISGGPPGYALDGPQGYGQGGSQGHAPGVPQDHAPVGPGLLRKRNTTVKDNYDHPQDLAQDGQLGALHVVPISYVQGAFLDNPSGGPQDHVPGGPQSYAAGRPQGYAQEGPQGYAPAGHKGYAPGGSHSYALGGPQGYATGGSQGYAPGGPQGYGPGGPQRYAPGGPQGYAPGGPQGYAPGGPQGYAPGGPQGYTRGGSQGYAPGGPQDYAPGVPQGFAPGGPQSYAPGGPQGYAPVGPQGYAPGGPQGYAPVGPQGYAPGGPQGYAPVGPQGYVLGGPQGYAPGGPQGYTPGGPQGYAPGGPQGYAPGGPQGYTPGGPQGYAPGGPQGYAPGGPQGYTPGGPQGYTSGGPQGYAPRGPQGYAPGGPQGYTPGGPQGYAPGGPQGYALDGPQGYAPGAPKDYTPGAPQDYAPGAPQDYAPGGIQHIARSDSNNTKEFEKDGSQKKRLTGILDGMTIDSEGNLWVANFNRSQVLTIDPKKGKLLRVIPIPALLVTSVTFGGPALDVVYVTSAATNRKDKKLQHSPAGSTFVITNTGVKGHPNYNVRFNHRTKRSSKTKLGASKHLK